MAPHLVRRQFVPEETATTLVEPEEVLVADPRGGLTPPQIVEQKLLALLGSGNPGLSIQAAVGPETHEGYREGEHNHRPRYKPGRAKGPTMRNPVAIETIEEMRRREGIEDVELRAEIRGLEVGDFVKLTFLSSTEPSAGETLLVRITRLRGSDFRGELAKRPSSTGLSSLRVGSPVAFTAAHIHSIPKRQPAHEQ
jgi:hypothetical protein